MPRSLSTIFDPNKALPARRAVSFLLCAVPPAAAVVILWAFLGEAEVLSRFAALRLNRHALTRAAEILTDYGIIAVNIPYILVLARALTRRQRPVIRFLLSYAVSLAAILVTVQLIKAGVGRGRPYLDGGFLPWSWEKTYDSFPSGHTTEAAAAALPLALLTGSIPVSLLLGLHVTAVAVSRMYLGVHFPTDVLGGLFMGGVSGLITWRLWAGRRAPEQEELRDLS